MYCNKGYGGFMFKKIFSAWLLFLISAMPAFSLNSMQTTHKVNIAVFDFEGKGITQAEASALTERFRSVLVSTNKFNVVERQKIKLIMDELGLQLSGMVSEKSISKAGELLGVNRIISGTIGKIGDTYTVDLRIIAVETGKVIRTVSQNTNGSKENLIALLERLAKRFAGIKTELKKYDITILSLPGKSSVYMDGKYIGLTPMVVKLTEGDHKIRIQHESYSVWKGKIQVNKPDKIIAKLEAKPSHKKTWLWIGAGTLVAGGGIVAAVLLGSKKAEKEKPIGLPPVPPGE